jgi:hypothetical protein
MYGPTSPSGPPYQYMGYMSSAPSPRTSFSPMQQPARPPFFQQPAAQMEGSFQPGPSLPPNFRLQLPPHAVSRESDNASGSQPAQPTSSDAATSTNNQEASGPVTSNSDPNTSNWLAENPGKTIWCQTAADYWWSDRVPWYSHLDWKSIQRFVLSLFPILFEFLQCIYSLNPLYGQLNFKFKIQKFARISSSSMLLSKVLSCC